MNAVTRLLNWLKRLCRHRHWYRQWVFGCDWDREGKVLTVVAMRRCRCGSYRVEDISWRPAVRP